MRIPELLLNLYGWLQIVIGAMLLGFIPSALIYYFNNKVGLTVGVVLISIGFILGAIWATKIWIKHGTVDWLSRIRRVS